MKLEANRYKTGQKTLTVEEYLKLKAVITDTQDELMIRLGIDTMLRREDLCNIECNNIDLKNCKLRFHEAKKDTIVREPTTTQIIEGKKVRVKGKPILENGKIRREEKWRTIDLSPEIVVVIQKFYNTLDRNELKKRRYLFDYVGRTAYRHFQHWCEVAGINTRPIHALRGTGIKFAHNAGWTDEQIADITGDKISTIQEHYMTPSVDEMRQVKQKKSFI